MLALIPTGRAPERVELAQVPDPQPADDHALVRVEAFSLNRPDFLYLLIPNSRWRVGIDAAGVVERAAADGSGPPVGTRVLAHVPEGGGGAALLAAPTRQVAPLPDALDTTTAAALPLAGLVALRLVRAAGALAGRRVMLTGATGGVGQYAAQLAIAAGAEVTAVTRASDPHDHLREIGATVVQDVEAAIGRFDVLLESVGGAVGTAALGKLAHRADVLWFGAATREPLTLDFFSFFDDRESFTLRHFVYSDVDDADDASDLAALVELAADGRLQTTIGLCADWSQTAHAINQIASGAQQGKAVLTVPQS